MLLTVHITPHELTLWGRVALSVLVFLFVWRWVRWHFAKIDAAYAEAKRKLDEEHEAALREIDERYKALEALAPFYRPASTREVEAAAVLDVSVNATIDEIRAAYRRKARSVHPDLVTEAERDEAAERFVVFNAAFIVMTERWRRWRGQEGRKEQR